MSSRMRATRSKTRMRRSHHGLTGPRLSRDTETGSLHQRHRLDMETGMYRGKQLIDVAAQKARKLERAKQKAKDRGEDPDEVKN